MKLTPKLKPLVPRAGYTLMEMMLVLLIIGLLLGSGVYLMRNVDKDAQIIKVQADIKSFETNLIRYQTRALAYPTQQQGLSALVTRPTIEPIPKIYDPLLKPEALRDPWGHAYQYRFPGAHNPSSYDVFSVGPDGVEGTQDDIGNW